MSLTITKRPALYTAALIPIVYKMQRKDYSWNTLDSNSGKARITFTGVNIVSSFSVGDVIYLKSSDNKYDIITTVTGSVLSGSDTKVTTNATYAANATNGFVNNSTKRALYKVRINVYDPVSNTVMFPDGFLFSTDSKGVATIDVQFLKQLMAPEIASIGSYQVITQDVKKFVDFYIGYTEVWLGSSNSETLDNSNVRYAVYGSLQVGGNNDYVVRVSSKILSTVSKLRAFIGKYFDLSFFGLTTSHKISIEHYAADGSLTLTEARVPATDGVSRIAILPASTDNSIIAKVLSPLASFFTILSGTLWTNWGVALAFTKSTSTLSANGTSNQNYAAQQPCTGIDLTTFDPITISVQISGTWSGQIVPTIWVYDSAQNYRLEGPSSPLTANGTYSYTVKPSSFASTLGGWTDIVLVKCFFFNGNTGTANVVITIPNGQTVYNYTSVAQQIEVKQACVRPVTLTWNNRLGGQDWWTFQYSQEVSYAYNSDRQVRRLLLHAEDLSYEQWQMLNGLSVLGEVYDRSITEMSYDLMGTQKKVGSQVYLMLDDFSLLEIIVTSTVNTTQTKKERHTFDLLVELPDGFEGNNFLQVMSAVSMTFTSILSVSTAQPSTPSIEWEVDWFGHIPTPLKSSDIANTFTQVQKDRIYQIPDAVSSDIVIRVRKLSNGGIAQATGSITFTKNGAPYPSLTLNFVAGDDVSEKIFIMKSVSITGGGYNGVTINEQV